MSCRDEPSAQLVALAAADVTPPSGEGAASLGRRLAVRRPSIAFERPHGCLAT
jgi:hypothetical protein